MASPLLALALVGCGCVWPLGRACAQALPGPGLVLSAHAGLGIGRTEAGRGQGPGGLWGLEGGLRAGWEGASGLGAGLAVGGLVGPSQSGAAEGSATVAVAELSGRPWPLLMGPLSLRLGLGVGRFAVAPREASAPASFRLGAWGLALRGGVSYVLWGAGSTPGGPREPGFALGPSVQITHLPVARAGDGLTWVSLGFEGRWSSRP